MYSIRAHNARLDNLDDKPLAEAVSKRGGVNATLVARQQGARQTFSDSAWELSLLSVPPGEDWRSEEYTEASEAGYKYTAQTSFGEGQVIYVVEQGLDRSHTVSGPCCCLRASVCCLTNDINFELCRNSRVPRSRSCPAQTLVRHTPAPRIQSTAPR